MDYLIGMGGVLRLAGMSAVLAGAACGSVIPGGGGIDAPPVEVPRGTFKWQRNLEQSFSSVLVNNNAPVVVASQFGAVDFGGGTPLSHAMSDVAFARYNADGVHQVSWNHGGAGNEFQVGSAVATNGNPVIIAQYFGIGSAGGADFADAPSGASFVASYTDAGVLRWALPVNSPNQIFITSLSIDGSSNAIIGGTYNGTMTVGGTTLTSAGGGDGFFVRVHDDGLAVVKVSIGGTGDDGVAATLADANGSVMVVGTFTGSITFATTPNPTTLDAGTGRDVFIARMSNIAAPMWAIQAGGAMDAGAGTVAAVTPAGDVVVATTYNGSFAVNGGTAVTEVGAGDIAMFKVSSAGTLMWLKSFGGAGIDLARKITVTSNTIALSGEFAGASTFGGDTLTSAGFLDAFLGVYDADGNHLYSRRAGGAADDRGGAAGIDTSGAVYWTLNYHGTINVGGADVTAVVADWDSMIVKYSGIPAVN